MTVHLNAELEALVTRDVERGAYRSADEFLEHAVRLLHAQEEWFAENREEIAAKIEQGYAAAQRGELLEPEELHLRLAKRKAAWIAPLPPE
jgi:putative addiction module CopG family antidote